MHTVLDQTNDHAGREIHRLTKLYDAPDFVKNASDEQLRGTGDLQRHLYADPARKRYPLHTKAATYTSMMFFLDKKAAHAPERAATIEANLDKAAKYHSIANLTERLKTVVDQAEQEKLAALTDEDFALVTDSGERHYPLRNALEVKQAAAWFDRYRDELRWEHRQTLASKILKKAAEHGADVRDHSEVLEKCAGIGTTSAAAISKMLSHRILLTQRQYPSHAAELRKVAAAVQTQPHMARQPQTLYKIAAAVDDYDRETHLNRRYANDLGRPEDTLFEINQNMVEKVAAEHVSTTTGNIYTKEALNTLQLNDVRDWMGTDFADEVAAGGLMLDTEKLAQLVPTLPRNDATMFDRLMAAKNVPPRAKEAAHHDQGLSRDRLVELARKYGG